MLEDGMQAQPAWFAVLQVLTPLTVVPPQLAREQAGGLELHEGGGGTLVVVVDVVSFVVVLVVVLGLDDVVLLEVGADDVVADLDVIVLDCEVVTVVVVE